MLGAIAGDVIGSVHEGAGTKTLDFPLFAHACCFTDDTVLTVATADCLLHRGDPTALSLRRLLSGDGTGGAARLSRFRILRRRDP